MFSDVYAGNPTEVASDKGADDEFEKRQNDELQQKPPAFEKASDTEHPRMPLVKKTLPPAFQLPNFVTKWTSLTGELFEEQQKGSEIGRAHHSSRGRETEIQPEPDPPGNEWPGRVNESSNCIIIGFLKQSTMSAISSNPPAGAITLNRCRACSGGDGFHYSHNGWTTKAVSYVWGDTKPLPLHCLRCRKTTQIPMESEEKFRRIMTLIDRPGQSLWLDALSIDQADHADIAEQMAVIDGIYSNARSVAVLLAKSDGDAYKMIEEMADMASLINTYQRAFVKNHEDAETEWLEQRCKSFFVLADEFERNIHKWMYWKRAWTFQGWALAYELGLTWEGSTNLVNLANIKAPILKAATTMVVYKLQCDAVNETEARFEAFTPSISFRNALGLRQAARGHNLPCYAAFNLDAALPTSKEQRFLERFSVAMHTRGVTKREASSKEGAECHAEGPWDDDIQVPAGIVVESKLEDGHGQFKTWAICPAHTDLDKCFVAREALSGTFVIAASEEDSYRVVAYLTVTDNRSASSLIKMDEQGKIDIFSPGMLQPIPEGATCQGYIEEETVVAF
ncbi:heterokaryon incompatibility protein-domain-containing protein [Lineolata rhizophorae]|uniref:Heterokaryon incompatibility protein-domain-containing protein n=1 Tax=Lineolata rhizophorae TaxID=578093 RepID=A0A6A6P156_9PEZI|nr:heterokaryon incompatibility protein-domain-containing protein [Lineolata rhizophorae]